MSDGASTDTPRDVLMAAFPVEKLSEITYWGDDDLEPSIEMTRQFYGGGELLADAVLAALSSAGWQIVRGEGLKTGDVLEREAEAFTERGYLWVWRRVADR